MLTFIFADDIILIQNYCCFISSLYYEEAMAMKDLDRLSRAAYWQLGKEEATDIINDYKEIFEEKFSVGADLSYKLDHPYQIIKCLRNKRQYFRWISVFSIMIICLLSMAACLFTGGYYLWSVAGLYFIGEGLSMLYFRSLDREKRHEPRPRKLLLFMFAELVLALVILSVAIMSYIGFNTEMVQVFDILSSENIGRTITRVIQIIAVILSGLGVFSLYKAKVSDRRWRALYCFGITVVLLCSFVVSYQHSVNLGSDQGVWSLFIAFLGIGCMITGVSLY